MLKRGPFRIKESGITKCARSTRGKKAKIKRVQTVAFCVSQEWCRILPRGISAVCIVFVVFLRFFLPKTGRVRTPVWVGMSVGDEDLV